MNLKVIQIGDPILEQKANRVEEIKDKAVQELIDGMLAICEKNESKTAGLSAPQVGKPLAISICRRTDLEETSNQQPASDLWEVMVNPEITWQSKEKSTVWEGCLSVGKGDKTLFGPVTRPEKIKVKFQNRVGENIELEATDFFSHVVQHELDHLQGILFLKYVQDPENNLWTSKELDNYMDKHDSFPPIK